MPFLKHVAPDKNVAIGIYAAVLHTPVRTALDEGNILTLDTFSTYTDGRPIGDERFVWVDTVEKKWEFVE